MASERAILCIQCGSPVGDPPTLNTFPDGEPCRVCRDRVLEALPPALPFRRVAEWAVEEEQAGVEEEEEAEPRGVGPRPIRFAAQPRDLA